MWQSAPAHGLQLPIAHDGKRADLVAFATFSRSRLVRNAPLATNSATADALIGSPLLTTLRAAS